MSHTKTFTNAKINSQKDMILNALLHGEEVTPMSALAQFRCFRLGARILELKKDYPIVTKYNTTTPRYAIYSLSVDYLRKRDANQAA